MRRSAGEKNGAAGTDYRFSAMARTGGEQLNYCGALMGTLQNSVDF